MTRNLLILGAGQYGCVVRDIALATGDFTRIDFLDDHHPDAIGRLADHAQFAGRYTDALVAIGNPDLRLSLLEALKAHFHRPVLIHPQATVMPSASLQGGCIVEAQAVVNSHAVLGTGCLICAGAVVNHNAVLGDGRHIDCLAAVAARSLVPDRTKVDIGTVYR